MSNAKIKLIRFQESVRIGSEDIPSVNCEKHDIVLDYEKRVVFVTISDPKTKAQRATAEVPFENIRQITRYDDIEVDKPGSSATSGIKEKGRFGSEHPRVAV